MRILKYEFNKNTGRFDLLDSSNFEQEIGKSEFPLSVILQITRRCHFDCKFCSEKGNDIADTSLDDLEKIKNNLQGVKRVFISGGEPLIRKDFSEVVDIFHKDFILGLPTNAVATTKQTQIIKDKISLVNIGFEGPRNITSKVRGDYDIIMQGIHNFIKHEIPYSMTSVVMRSYLKDVIHICNAADILGAQKLKLVFPINKGNAIYIPESEYPSQMDGVFLAKQIAETKKRLGWRTIYTLSTWTPETNGYSILAYPNGETFAWPVFDKPEKVERIGNIIEEDIRDIWKRYKYKENHYKKYFGKSIKVL